MKRMSELKADLRGIKCAATIEAFKYMKSQKRKPYIVQTPTANYIRVTVDGMRFDLSPTTGAWIPTRQRGNREWYEAGSPQEFYESALRVAAGVYPPTRKQVSYLKHLLDATGEEMTCGVFDDARQINYEIDRLKTIKEARLKPTPATKPRLTAADQKVYIATHKLFSRGLIPSNAKLAFMTELTEEQVINSSHKLRVSGLIAGMINHASAPNRAQLH